MKSSEINLSNFMLIIYLSASGKLKAILVCINDFIVYRKFIYEILIAEIYSYV